MACAQCHDHKYDPIPTKDFYALLGVFRNTKTAEFALVSKDKAKLYKDHDKALKNARNTLKEYLHRQSAQLGEILAVKTPDYIRASREILSVKQRAFSKAAEKYGLDRETLERWVEYLSKDHFDHPFLDGWCQASFDLAAFQVKFEEVLEERKVVDDENLVRSKIKSKGKKGLSARATDEWGYAAVEKKVHVHDLHATVLHQLGIDHERLTYHYSGREFRLTDVAGNVVRHILT